MKTFFKTRFLGFDVTSRKRYRRHIEWLEQFAERMEDERNKWRAAAERLQANNAALSKQLQDVGVTRGADGRFYSTTKKTS